MRWVYLIIVIVFVAALVVFGVQNLQTATMSFLGFSVSAPLVVLAVVFYVGGAVTGGSLYALLRKSVRESRGGLPVRA
jgi:lipopolysaccharide assembly protein A